MSLDAQRGKRLLDERIRLGLVQQRIADQLGIRREMWAKYEAGAEPGAAVLGRAATLGLDVQYVLTGVASSPEILDMFRRAAEAMAKSTSLELEDRAELWQKFVDAARKQGEESARQESAIAKVWSACGESDRAVLLRVAQALAGTGAAALAVGGATPARGISGGKVVIHPGGSIGQVGGSVRGGIRMGDVSVSLPPSKKGK